MPSPEFTFGQRTVQDLEDGEGYAALQAELLGDGGPQLPVLTERLQRAAKALAKTEADHSAYTAVHATTLGLRLLRSTENRRSIMFDMLRSTPFCMGSAQRSAVGYMDGLEHALRHPAS